MTRLASLFAKVAAAGCLSVLLSAGALSAQDPAAPTPSATPAAVADAVSASPAPTERQSIGVMEAYFTNSDPTAALKDKDGKLPAGLTTPVVGVPGPGHNAWMMASAALVLFMTLPGLALFYGGLVRRKNVLSVCAQCLGCAGLVTILWWAVGYSPRFRQKISTARSWAAASISSSTE